MTEVDPLSLNFIKYHIPALTPGLHWSETTLHFPDNKALLALSSM
jgi:hypothetical protein